MRRTLFWQAVLAAEFSSDNERLCACTGREFAVMSCRHCRYWIAFCFLSASGPAWSQTAATGGFSGSVVNARGVGVAATVRVTTPGSSKQGAPSKTGSDGSFSITGLAAGIYPVCATPASTGYVDSCVWLSGSLVKVTAGKIAIGQKVFVETAGTLQVQINDPAGLLSGTSSTVASTVASAAAPAGVATHLMVGVVTDSKLFLSAPILSTGATGRTHALAVPVDRNVSLRLVAHGLTVATATAPNVDLSGTAVPVKVASGQPNTPLVFTVKGVTP